MLLLSRKGSLYGLFLAYLIINILSVFLNNKILFLIYLNINVHFRGMKTIPKFTEIWMMDLEKSLKL